MHHPGQHDWLLSKFFMLSLIKSGRPQIVVAVSCMIMKKNAAAFDCRNTVFLLLMTSCRPLTMYVRRNHAEFVSYKNIPHTLLGVELGNP